VQDLQKSCENKRGEIVQLNILEQELNKKILHSIYLLYGEEKYLLENAVNKIKKNFGPLQEGINYCILDESNVENIISEIETPSFGFEKKLIIVNKAGLLNKETKTKRSTAKSTTKTKTKTDKLKKESDKKPATISTKLAEYIENNLEVITQSVVLIIIEDNVEKCTLLEVLNTLESSTSSNNVKIITCEFQKLRLNEIVIRLKHICNLYNVQVEESTLSYLVEIAGTSMQNLINEIRKLIEYAGENGKITKADVELLAIQNIDNIIFNLTDSLGVKDTKKALETLKDLIYLKEPLQSIMINLYRHFKKLYFIKVAEKANANTNIIELLDLKPNQTFLVTKYKKQASYFNEQELRLILKEMLELDEKSKSGNMDLQVGLEVLIAGVNKKI